MKELYYETAINRVPGFMYYIKGGAIWKVPRKQAGKPKGKASQVVRFAKPNELDMSFLYYVGKDGNVWRAERAAGGHPRKSTSRARAVVEMAEDAVQRRREGRPLLGCTPTPTQVKRAAKRLGRGTSSTDKLIRDLNKLTR